MPDTKTGKSTRGLSHAAMAVLHRQRELTGGAKDALVFPPTRGGEGATMTGFKRFMGTVVKLAGLGPDVTAHVLRHSFASVAHDLDLSELIIGTLIGHKSDAFCHWVAGGQRRWFVRPRILLLFVVCTVAAT